MNNVANRSHVDKSHVDKSGAKLQIQVRMPNSVWLEVENPQTYEHAYETIDHWRALAFKADTDYEYRLIEYKVID